MTCRRCPSLNADASDGLCIACRTPIEVEIRGLLEHPVALSVLGLNEILDIYYKKGLGFFIKVDGEVDTLREATFVATETAEKFFPPTTGQGERLKRAIHAMMEGVKATIYGQLVDRLTIKKLDVNTELALIERLATDVLAKKPVIRVFHRYYGCETGCCGHSVEVDEEEIRGAFIFGHPGQSEKDKRKFAREMIEEALKEQYPECLASIDWDTVDLSGLRSDC